MFRPQSYYITSKITREILEDDSDQQSKSLIRRLIDFTYDLFHGSVPGFQPCDMAFHDFDHTMQATAAVLDLLDVHRRGKSTLSDRDWEITIAAVLLHDSGYLKLNGDHDGSGAKYSTIHVGRSCFFAWDLLPRFGFEPDELRLIQNAICATAISAEMRTLDFRSEREWLIGAIVGTGDMLGQMAAEDYPERLAGLYLEFREASRFSRFERTSFAVYRNLLDLLCGTEKFLAGYVMPMLDVEWCGIYHLLDRPDGTNPYIDQIRKNIRRVNVMARQLAEDGIHQTPRNRTVE
jgi:hypothetical protein